MARDPQRRRRLLANLGIAACTVLLYVAGLEVYLRLRHQDDGRPDSPDVQEARDLPAIVDPAGRYSYEGIYRPSPDPQLKTELVPGARGVVNRAGYVGTEYPIARNPGTFRVVGLGDSITMYYSAERQNYLQVAERLLRERPEGQGTEVLDFGVGGYDTTQEVRQFELKGLQYKPDLVTVGFCINDAVDLPFTINEATGTFTFAQDQLDHPEVVSFLARALGDKLPADRFFQTAFAQPRFRESLAAFDRLQSLALQHHFRVLVLLFPVLTDFRHYAFQPFHQRMTEELQRRGLETVDLWPAFAQAGSPEDLGASAQDLIHPNARGHDVAGQALARRIGELRLLQQRQAAEGAAEMRQHQR